MDRIINNYPALNEDQLEATIGGVNPFSGNAAVSDSIAKSSTLSPTTRNYTIIAAASFAKGGADRMLAKGNINGANQLYDKADNIINKLGIFSK
jgi:hypothetical protein